MAGDNNIASYLGPLTHRLSIIQDTFQGIPKNYWKHIVQEVEVPAIYSLDPEDSQDYILKQEERIGNLIEDLPNLIKAKKFTPIHTQIESEFPFRYKTITSSKVRNNTTKELIAELDFYRTELHRIRVQFETILEDLGSIKFTNAGFQLELSLTVEEMGTLFNALYESEIIKKTNHKGEEISKIALASFISKNFLTNNGQSPSAKNLFKNCFKARAATGKFQTQLQTMMKHLK